MNSAGGRTQERRFENLAWVVRQWANDEETDRGVLRNATDRNASDRNAGDRNAGDRNAGDDHRWSAIEERLDKQRVSFARRRVLGVSVLASVATVVLVLVALRGKQSPERKLSYVVSGGTPTWGDPARPVPSPARLTFSDGSDVVLRSGARGWVVGTSARGARVRLEEGRARFAVTHRPHTDWSVEAGPFTVIVHGTVFEVAWTAAQGALAVDLLVGSITVKGPLGGGVVTLKAGQRLTARAETGQTQIDDMGTLEGFPSPPAMVPVEQSPPGSHTTRIDVSDPRTSLGEAADIAATGVDEMGDIPAGVKGAGPAPVPRLSPSLEASEPVPAFATGEGRRVAGRSTSTAAIRTLSATWSSRVARGSFQGVVDDADAAGVERCLALAPVHSLVALADAARYVRRIDLARRALLAERRRFPSAVGAHDAAFLIGRLAEDATRDLPEALLWYDRYLEEETHGSYTSEALGRKMLALHHLGEWADARRAAEQYLATSPRGAYVARALRIQAQGASQPAR